jgi:zinc protease
MKKLFRLLGVAQFIVFLSVSTFVTASELAEFKKLELEGIETLEMNEDNLGDQQSIAPQTKRLNLVKKHILKNGMTILVREMHNIPKVSLQLWYNVGSKDEKTGERGIAHLIEHMIFKGTKKLSETDINTASHMLSATINAFTSYDYTGYLFNLPTHNWHEALPIMADCMMNAAFKDDHLNSEMKAVIQELKMYKDSFYMSLAEELISTIFVDHPYHYPIIGFKQDLWSVHGDDLRKFYKKHYAPNNATLVVVGDVKAEEVFKEAEEQFGAIPSNPEYKKDEYYFNQDIMGKSVTLYRDVQQPISSLVFVTPGISNRKEHVLEIASWILGTGKSSRLYKKIVDELKLATSLSTAFWDLFDHSIFFIYYEPKSVEDIPTIEKIIFDELDSIVREGISEEEVSRAIKKAQMKLYSVMENTEKQAYEIGKYYLATGDENYIYNYLSDDVKKMAKEVQELITQYFRPTVANRGAILPLPENEMDQWVKLQKKSDDEDEKFLSARKRDSKLEEARYSKSLKIKEPEDFQFPKASSLTLPNGIKVLYYNNENNIPKINLVIELKARQFYGPEDKPGLYSFVTSLMTEGTEKYSAVDLAEEIESRGMSLYINPGHISMSMLSSDLDKGLELLQEVLTKATFPEEEIEKVRFQLISEIKNFWDDPASFAGQVIRETMYKGHPYSRNVLGTIKSIESITREDLLAFYKKYISPDGAKLAVVGDLKNIDLKKSLESSIGKWSGSKVEDIEFPALDTAGAQAINYPINRDQVVLAYARLSIDRKNPDFDKLLMFDQIFGGGALHSMYARLFKLREQSGLFYSINGTMISNADEQTGMAIVKTIVSLDRLKEAEKVIKHTIDTVAETVKPDELVQARHAIVNSIMNNFESNSNIASAFLFLDRYKFPADFFDKRNEQLKAVDLEGMKQAVEKYLHTKDMNTFKIGRVEK